MIALEQSARRVILVCGPPCAGKTTYVRQHAQLGDLILDQDTIGAAAMRHGLAQLATMTTGTAWVIRCAPGPRRRDQLVRQIAATDVVLLAPDQAELIGRAKLRPDPRRHIAAIRAWYADEQANRPPHTLKPGRTAPRRTSSAGRGGRVWRRFRKQVLQRYGNWCHLCDEPIDLSLDPQHRWAYVVDHDPPLALGGAPYNLDTARPAHRYCNGVRGIRPVRVVRALLANGRVRAMQAREAGMRPPSSCTSASW